MTYVVRIDGDRRSPGDRAARRRRLARCAEDRTYKVGVSSYVASSYDFAHKDPGRSLQTTTADALIRFLESGADLGVYRDIQRAFQETAARRRAQLTDQENTPWPSSISAIRP